jgi:hypothetical protein
MVKIRFALDIEDGWPPVITENVWCEKSGDTYELMNAPFFITGLAYGDKFTAESDKVNGCIFEFVLVKSSGHSLAWVINNDDLDFSVSKSQLIKLGCRIEGFPAFNLYSIDVPVVVDSAAVNTAMDNLEELGFAIAFPVWRHEVGDA